MIKALILTFLVGLNSWVFAQNNKIVIPIGGNAFINHSQGARITARGIENWTSPNETVTLYFRIAKTGTIILSINEARLLTGKSVLEFSINRQAKRITLDAANKYEGIIGSWTLKDTGYVAVTIKGISKTSTNFASIVNLNVGGTAVDIKTTFVKNNEGNFFYWGRRGPSVHLNYELPENTNAEWFYNEVTVPKGDDVQGSYFMANGFGEGYFGMQVNSPTERRILFSVWSPFNTDDPKSIPASHQIKILKKGPGVYTGEFGNEGAGGQSYLKYNWKAGHTYKFLLQGAPGTDSTTTYTAYFFAPELNEWQLIASFKRPQTKTYLKRLHSFLENFIPEFGAQTRKVWFNNQWICNAAGNWTELNTARFTTDNTGNKKYRMDFAGGLNNGAFYLKNCGFFNNFTTPKTIFTRKAMGKKPQINFNKLP
ncbi:MAG: DUF3472 domain-containing protein [Bacteroidota bacterium]